MISEEAMRMALDAWDMIEAQANEHVILTTDDANTQNIVLDDLAGKILWSAPIPRKEYERDRAWKAAQEKLHELRRRRVVLAIAGALSIGGAS